MLSTKTRSPEFSSGSGLILDPGPLISNKNSQGSSRGCSTDGSSRIAFFSFLKFLVSWLRRRDDRDDLLLGDHMLCRLAIDAIVDEPNGLNIAT